MNPERVVLSLVLCVLYAAIARAEETLAVAEARPALVRLQRRNVDRTLVVAKQLERSVPLVDFDETPFEEVLDWFRAQGLQNIYVHWKQLDVRGEIDRHTPVTLRLAEMTLGELMDMVLADVSREADDPQGQLTYHINRGVIEVSNRAEFDSEMIVRVYDVEHLLQNLVFRKDAPEISVTGSSGRSQGSSGRSGGESGGGAPIFDPNTGRSGDNVDYEARRDGNIDDLIELLKQTRPDSWEEKGGSGTISLLHGKLIIAQTLEIHEMIGGHVREKTHKP